MKRLSLGIAYFVGALILAPAHGSYLRAQPKAPGALPPKAVVGSAAPQKAVLTEGLCVACYSEDDERLIVSLTSVAKGEPVLRLNAHSTVNHPPQWQFSQGYLWSDQNLGFANQMYRYRAEYLFKGWLSGRADGMVDPSSVFLPPMGPLKYIREMGQFCEFPYRLYSDYHPTSSEAMLVFVVTNARGRIVAKPSTRTGEKSYGWVQTREEWTTPGWTFNTYRIQVQLKPQKDWVWDLTFEKVDTLEASFYEQFQVLALRDVYYFVTASGKLYRTGNRRFLTRTRYVEPVWDDTSRPITHFLTDADADRTFLFCKPAKEGEPGVYFELGPKAEPKPYDLSKVKPSKAAEPLKGVLERARFLADQKLLKHPEPPKEEKKP